MRYGIPRSDWLLRELSMISARDEEDGQQWGQAGNTLSTGEILVVLDGPSGQ